VKETLTVLRELDQGRSVRELKTMVIEHDLLGKVTQATRVTAWARIHARYLADQNEARILARMVVRARSRDREIGAVLRALSLKLSTFTC
jgi:hypothetical protein